MEYIVLGLLGLTCILLLALLIKKSLDLLPPKPPSYTEADRDKMCKRAIQILYNRDRD